MNDDIAIKIEGLTKIYKIFDRPIDRVKEALNPFHKRYSKDFYALNDVSFEIKKGETVGIIGKNGAGKSTLLKIITGVLTPTSGSVEVNGRIASLLELGAGFNPEMTGIENIYMNGSVMGYGKKEMDEKIDAIIDFADIGDFIYQPVKMYSSGMFARLAFAMNSTLEPDVLIVDEALAVGDFMFQFKCMQRFKELQQKGSTILFVTHITQQVVSSCNRAIFFNEGKLMCDSRDVEMVVYKYERFIRNIGEKSNEIKMLGDDMPVNQSVGERRMGTYEATVEDIVFKSENEILQSGQVAHGEIQIKAKKYIPSVVVGFLIKNKTGDNLWGDNTLLRCKDNVSLNVGVNIINFSLPINFSAGEYLLYIGLADISGNERIELDRRWPLKKITVISKNNMADGYIYAPMSFSLRKEITNEY